jgi:hypothetical protein
MSQLYNIFDTLEEFEIAQNAVFEAEKKSAYDQLDSYYIITNRKATPIEYNGKYVAPVFSEQYPTITIDFPELD